MNRDQIDEMMRENGIVVVGEAVYALVQLVIEHEREECAKVCEAQENKVVQRHPVRIEFDPNSIMARSCAAAIRARGEQK